MLIDRTPSRTGLWAGMALAAAALWGLIEVVALARARWSGRLGRPR
jgi:hypothetical protein